jgi:hypothetical protein
VRGHSPAEGAQDPAGLSIEQYLDALVARLREILGDELLGVYAGGSLALGAFDPQRSDLDVAAVIRGALSDGTKRTISEALRHEALPCPARGLELVLYPESTVREATGRAGYELNLNTGRALFHVSFGAEGEAEHWYAIDRAILREHGVALAGPPARELFAPIPHETLLSLLLDSVRWHEEEKTRADDAVLNACRARRYAAEGSWWSKVEAGEWARTRAEDAPLVSQALAARVDDRPLDALAVARFLAETRRQLGGRP